MGRTSTNLKVSDLHIVVLTFDLPYYFDCQCKRWQNVANKSYWWMIKSPISRSVLEIPHFGSTNFCEIDSYTMLPYVDKKIAEFWFDSLSHPTAAEYPCNFIILLLLVKCLPSLSKFQYFAEESGSFAGKISLSCMCSGCHNLRQPGSWAARK